MKQKVCDFLRRFFSLDDSPERIAGAFALGIFLAFSPLLGLHTFIGLILAFSFSLNRFALLAGLFINNPWTLIPIYAAGTYLGGMLLGFPPRPALPSLEWHALWSSSFWQQLAGQWLLLKPLVLGSFILSFLVSAFSYFMVLHLMRQRRARREKY